MEFGSDIAAQTGRFSRFLFEAEGFARRRLIRLGLLAGGLAPLVILPVYAIWFASTSTQLSTSLENGVEAGLERYFARAIPFTPTEAKLANEINLPAISPLDRRVPVWDAPPGDERMFSIAKGTPSRLAFDTGWSLMQSVEQLTGQGVGPTDAAVHSQMQQAALAFNSVARDQGHDRVLVLYHRALLNLWSPAGSSAALTDLGMAEKNIAAVKPEGLSQLSRDRIDGALVAVRFAQGIAWHDQADLTGNKDDLRRAVTSFRTSLQAANSYQSRSRLTEPSGIVALEQRRAMFDMDTARVWNDLLVSESQLGETSTANQEAGALYGAASLLVRQPALSATLMAVAATAGDRRAVRQFAATDWSRNSDIELSKRLAAASQAVVGLAVQRELLPAEQGPQHGLRSRFEALRLGSPDIGFPRIEFPGVRDGAGKSDLLDNWLFFRLWRDELENGKLRLFLRDYARLEQAGDIKMPYLSAWRRDALGNIGSTYLADIESGAISDKEEVDAIYGILSNSYFSFWTRAEAYSEHAFGLHWWQTFGLSLFWLLICLCIVRMMKSYEYAFTPWYYSARRRSGGEPGHTAGGDEAGPATV